jgi:hypothetical protein
MPSIDRTTILTGPALVQFASQSFWAQSDLTVTVDNILFPINTAHFGEVDKRYADRKVVVAFTPSGAFTAGALAVLWPYAATAIGASIYGGTDRPLVVWTRDGKKLTIHNATITKMPAIRLGVDKTIMGPVEFTGILKNSTDPTNAAAYYTLADQAYPGDTGFSVSDIKTLAYASAWGGSSPWSAFSTEAGWEISLDMQTRAQTVDGLGTTDMTLAALSVTARCIPVGPSQSDIFAKIAPASALGSSLAAASNPLNISATGVYVRVYNAAISKSGFVHANDKKRISQTEWMATRTVTSGAADPLFFVGTAAPV